VKKVKLALIIVFSITVLILLFVFLPKLLNKPPNVPTNPTPGNNEKGVSIFPVLSWSASDPDGDKLLYDLYFGKDEELELLVSNLATNSYTTKKLEYGTTYNWRVVVKDERGNITEGPIWKFITNYLPNIPSNPSPEDGAIDVSTKPVLSWDASDPDGDKLLYDLYFGKNPHFEIPVISNYEKNQFETENLDFKTTYYWKIVAKDEKGGVKEGPIWKFTTIKQNDPPYIPNNPSPVDGVTGQPINLELTWKSGDPDNDEVSYAIYFGEVGNLKKIVDDLKEAKYMLKNLKFGTMYNWKVVAKDGKGGISESPVWQFTTNYLPEVIDKPEPEDGASGVSTSPILRWEARDKDGDKLIYDVYLGKGEDLKLIASDLSTETYKVEGLENGEVYSWKVVIKDERGGVVEGPVWKFRTKDTLVQWQKIYGGSNNDIGYSIQKTSDNGYVIAGYTNSKDGDVKENKGEYDAWIVKLDNSGNIKWQRIFGGSNIDLAKSIKQTKDGGYIVVGWTTSIDKDIEQSHGLSDFWIIKLDENGEIVWQKVLGGSGQDMAESVAPSFEFVYPAITYPLSLVF